MIFSRTKLIQSACPLSRESNCIARRQSCGCQCGRPLPTSARYPVPATNRFQLCVMDQYNDPPPAALNVFHLPQPARGFTVMTAVPAKGNAQLSRRYLIFEIGVHTTQSRTCRKYPHDPRSCLPFRTVPPPGFPCLCLSICPRVRPPRLLLSLSWQSGGPGWACSEGSIRASWVNTPPPPHHAMAGQWPLSSVSALARGTPRTTRMIIPIETETPDRAGRGKSLLTPDSARQRCAKQGGRELPVRSFSLRHSYTKPSQSFPLFNAEYIVVMCLAI